MCLLSVKVKYLKLKEEGEEKTKTLKSKDFRV
jgi:hypothetical protein